jgi:hypothetical protein
MKISLISCFLLASSAFAFVPQQTRSLYRPLSMSEEGTKKEPAGALVPVKEETVEFTAGIIGGIAGFALGGPILGAIGAAAANYVSKLDGDATVAVNAVSKSSIEVFNYLANLDSKYEILTKAQASLQKSLDSLKKNDSVDPATIEKVESALAKTNSKIKEINDEYDLVGGATTALGVVGDLVEKAVKKAGEINEEYQLSSKAKEALSNAIEKAKVAAKNASN